jgi:hypothetical protein
MAAYHQGVLNANPFTLLRASYLCVSIGCTAETSRPPQPAQSPAPVATAVDSSALSPMPDSVSDSTRPVDPMVFLDTTERTALRTSEGKASRLGGELHIQLLNHRSLADGW